MDRGVDDGIDARCGGKALVHHGIEGSECADFRRGDADGDDDAEQVSDRDVAGERAPAGEGEEARKREAADEFEEGIDQRLGAEDLHVETRALNEALAGAVLLVGFEAERLHRARALEGFVEDGGEFARLLL